MKMVATACLTLILWTSLDARAAPVDEASTETPAKTKILVLDLEGSGIDEDQAELVNGTIAQTLSPFGGLEVFTTNDIRRVTDLEAQKQAMGCDADSCLAEIAGAMGAQYVIFGRLGVLGDRVLVQLNLFDAVKAEPVARQEVRGKDLGEVVDRMGPAVKELTRSLLPADAFRDVAAAPPTESGEGALTYTLRFGGGALAGLGLVAGTVAAVIAFVEAGVVTDPGKAAADRNSAKTVGAAMVITAAVSGALAAAGLGALGASFLDLE